MRTARVLELGTSYGYSTLFLADVVDFRLGDAVALINAEPRPFDFVLLDIWKELYVLPDIQTTLLPIGSGIELSVKWSAGNGWL